MLEPQDKVSERRSEHRLGFQGVILGHIRHQSHDLHFIAFDVSKKGLGIYLSPCPAEGAEISLELDNKKKETLQFTVKHIYGKSEGMQRCGIELVPKQAVQMDLIEVLTRYLE